MSLNAAKSGSISLLLLGIICIIVKENVEL